jgi:uncharacterized membrane protein YhhN
VYVVAFGVAGLDLGPAALGAAGLVVPAFFVVRWLWPQIPAGMRAPVAAYIVVISVMVAGSVGAAAGDAPALVVPAAAAFYVSDVFVARDRFAAPGFINRLLGLPLYYSAQVLFALSTGLI